MPPATPFLQNLLNHRVPQIMGLYLGASWGIIQFIEWTANRFGLSPNLAVFSFVILVSLIPTAFMLAYYHGQPGRDRWTRVERICIPANLLFSAALLFFLFQGQELGATATTIIVQDEDGNQIERAVAKNAFRKNVAIFFFANESADTTQNWLQYGLTEMISIDLSQDIFLSTLTGFHGNHHGFYRKMKEAGFDDGVRLPLTLMKKITEEYHYPYFISGSFDKKDSDYTASILIYETEHTRKIAEQSFSNSSIFNLVDEITRQIKHDLKIPRNRIEGTKDLPVSEITTTYIEAFKTYVLGRNALMFDNNYDKAIPALLQATKIDPSFAYANLWLGNTTFSNNLPEMLSESLQNALKHSYKLQDRDKFMIKRMLYFLDKRMDKVLAVDKMWSELYPDDTKARYHLAWDYRQRKMIDKAIEQYTKILEQDPDQSELIQRIGGLYHEQGELEKALNWYQRYAEKFPKEESAFIAIANLYKTMGKYENARQNYEKALFLGDEESSAALALAILDARMGDFAGADEAFKRLLKTYKDPKRRAGLYYTMRSFYEQRGQYKRALQYFKRGLAEQKRYDQPIELVFQNLGNISLYIKAGEAELAEKIVINAPKEISPPFDQMAKDVGTLWMAIQNKNTEKATSIFTRIERTFKMFEREDLRAYVEYYPGGELQELKGNYELALQSYEKYQKAKPIDMSIHILIGRCHRFLGNLDKAEEHLQKTLEMYPYNPNAHYEMALVLLEMNKREKAIEHLTRALDVWKDADPGAELPTKAKQKLAELRA